MGRKIYFNDKFIEFQNHDSQYSHNQPVKIYDTIEDESTLKKIVELFSDENDRSNIIIRNQNFEKIFEELKKYFIYIEAAGGFIEKNDEFLCIHRHGRWDLPKGKLEKGETPSEAGIRECEEECGVKKLKIIRPLSSSFHVYPHKKGLALKQSYWFYMRTDYDKKLKPQAEEDIDEVEWFSRTELQTRVLPDTYYTINDVITEGLALNFMTN